MSLCPVSDLGDSAKRAQMEYATQFFGYTPDALVDTLLGDVSEVISGNLKAAKKHICEQFKDKVSEEEVESSFARLLERQTEMGEAVFSKFCCYLKDKLLTVPAHILLPEDAAAHAGGGDVDDKAGSDDLTAACERHRLLCQRARQAKLRRAMLAANKEALTALLERQRTVLERMRAMRTRSRLLEAAEAEAGRAERKLAELRAAVGAGQGDAGKPLLAGEKRRYEIEDGVLEKKFKPEADSDDEN